FANIADKFADFRGVLGKKSFTPRLDDSVTLEGKLSRPAYCFLIAFRPNGTEEMCFPENEDEPPPLTDEPRYPALRRDEHYGLNEGTGLQVFALVASNRPLPAYSTWRAQLGSSPWDKHAVPGEVVWFDDGVFVETMTAAGADRGERAKGQVLAGKTQLVQL